MIEEDRLIGGENQSNEDLKAASVRPNSFADYIGQELSLIHISEPTRPY